MGLVALVAAVVVPVVVTGDGDAFDERTCSLAQQRYDEHQAEHGEACDLER